MKLVLQRGVADCAVAALATLLEQAYEDVYLAVSCVEETFRGKGGLNFAQLIKAAQAFRVTLTPKEHPDIETDEGVLAVKWPAGRARKLGYRWHFVTLAHGVIVDPSDGTILPAEEYLARERGRAGILLEIA